MEKRRKVYTSLFISKEKQTLAGLNNIFALRCGLFVLLRITKYSTRAYSSLRLCSDLVGRQRICAARKVAKDSWSIVGTLFLCCFDIRHQGSPVLIPCRSLDTWLQCKLEHNRLQHAGLSSKEKQKGAKSCLGTNEKLLCGASKSHKLDTLPLLM